jgi:hypothetical protein
LGANQIRADALTSLMPFVGKKSRQNGMGLEATLAPALLPFVGAIVCCHERVIMSAIRAIADFSRTALDRR